MMRVNSISNNISFKSGYRELDTVVKRPDFSVIKALDNARPYLKSIGNAMPENRDLVIAVTDDACDTFLCAYDYNRKNHKTKLLAKENEHTMTEHGLDFVQNVFEGIKKNDKKEFKEIAGDFVLSLKRIMWEQHPIEPLNLQPDPDWDPHPACCDD